MYDLKVTLIAMHQLSLETKTPLFECLGILTLSSALIKRSIEVDVLDLSSLNVGVISDYDSLIENVVDIISSSGPNVLGFSTMSNNVVVALEICHRVKQRHPKIVTILGGPGVSFSAERIISSFKQVDVIIRGEADSSFPDLVEYMCNNGIIKPVKGVVLRDGNRILDYGWSEPIEDLDSLPIPQYEICNNKADSDNSVTLEVGRGCPFACIFCSTSSFFKRKFRVKSVNRVIEELKFIQRKFGNRRILMNHDLLTFNRDYIISLCDALSKLDTPIAWGCSARLDTLDEEILGRMKKAGCDRIYLGIETATEKMQIIINKRLDLTNFDETLRTAIDLGFTLILSFVIGFPEETEDDLAALWEFIFKAKSVNVLKVKTQVNSLVPEPGSKLFKTLSEHLVYDDYGGPGHSDFPPLNWTYFREMIKMRPEIFPAYFYFNGPTIQRQHILKQVFLGQILDGTAKWSLAFAFSILSNKVTRALIENINEIKLPLPSWPAIDYRGTMESTQRILLKLFEHDDTKLQYNAIVAAEIAMHEVWKNRPDHYEFIEVWYNPIQLMKNISGLEFDSSQLEKRLRTLFVCWDEKKGGVRFHTIERRN